MWCCGYVVGLGVFIWFFKLESCKFVCRVCPLVEGPRGMRYWGFSRQYFKFDFEQR